MLQLYDTMTRALSPVEPLESGAVKMYTCGPTVYRDAHIGNLRSYLMADWIRRALQAHGVSVTQIKNITDVGHMRQEHLERGEDKVIAAAIDEGKTPQDIAQEYTARFLEDEAKLNILPAAQFPKATDHIDEMVSMTKRLIEQDLAYEVEGNVYFEVSKFPIYGLLSGNIGGEGLREAVRIEADPLKRAPRDFTLWKRAEPGRELKWDSPWGEGFPGWHIECSAMSIKYLGERFDIHTGGVDNIFPHHEGEIAQSQGYTGSPVVNLWVHGQHLLADGVKMAKSTGNVFTLADLETRGIDPLAFRYLCLTTRFGARLNFTFPALRSAQKALHRLRNLVWEWAALPNASSDGDAMQEEWWDRFMERVDRNLDMPGALAVVWSLARSELPGRIKLQILYTFDSVLGLGLERVADAYRVPEDILAIVERRDGARGEARGEHAAIHGEDKREARRALARQQGKWLEADSLRDEMAQSGYLVEDTANGARARPKSAGEEHVQPWPDISSSAEVQSNEGEPDRVDVTIGIVAPDYVDDVSRCLQSALRWAGEGSVEVIALDNGSTDGTGEWLQETAAKDSRVRVIHADHVLGEGAARNVILKQSLGGTVVMLDGSVEVVGDIFAPIEEMLNHESIGIVGPFGLRTADLHHFHDEAEGLYGEVDAMQAYCFAFRRSRIGQVGLMRETFRFYRNLDLDYSFHFKDKGLRVIADPSLPVKLHEHRAWSGLGEAERDELSAKNYRRFLHKWGERADLLVSNQPAQ